MKPIEIINKLNQFGFEAYIVGGALRDMLLGKSAYDIDIATNANYDDIITIFPGSNVVGNSFLVAIIDGIETTQYRKDIYYGFSDKYCNILPANSITEDLERRDLTINSMAYNPSTGEIIDPFGGMEDLENRIIRFTGNSNDRIIEDPCRIIRACRFAAEINSIEVHPESFNALKKHADLIRYIPPERIRLEILKCMQYPNASIFFCLLHTIGILNNIIPELSRGYDHPHGTHHGESIFDHNMICGDSISCKYPLLKLAGYLHDVGKPYSFYKHKKIGADIVGERLKALKFSNYEINYITNIIKNHMLQINGVNDKTLRKLMLKVDYKDFMRIRIADGIADPASDNFSYSEIRQIMKRFKHLNESKFEIKDLAVNGYDVMQVLNISPSSKVGEILKYLYDIVLENPDNNNRSYLLTLIKRRREDEKSN